MFFPVPFTLQYLLSALLLPFMQAPHLRRDRSESWRNNACQFIGSREVFIARLSASSAFYKLKIVQDNSSCISVPFSLRIPLTASLVRLEIACFDKFGHAEGNKSRLITYFSSELQVVSKQRPQLDLTQEL